jgi:hypothetical protein
MQVFRKLRQLVVGYRPGDYSVGQPVNGQVNCWICGRRASSVFQVASRCVGLCQSHDPRSRNPAEDWLYMWEIAPDERTLAEMREYGCKFAAYQNTDETHARRGELKFLRYGYKNNSYAVPPEVFPVADEDGELRYKFIGYVNLGKGTIHKNERDAEVADNPCGSGEDERLLPPSSNQRLWTRCAAGRDANDL